MYVFSCELLKIGSLGTQIIVAWNPAQRQCPYDHCDCELLVFATSFLWSPSQLLCTQNVIVIYEISRLVILGELASVYSLYVLGNPFASNHPLIWLSQHIGSAWCVSYRYSVKYWSIMCRFLWQDYIIAYSNSKDFTCESHLNWLGVHVICPLSCFLTMHHWLLRSLPWPLAW